MDAQAHGAPIEAQVDQWRRYVARRRAIAPSDVDEMEDHLRAQVDDLRETGLDDDEAFLVAVKRMGRLDEVSREFAREHSERLWKQLVLVPEGDLGTERTGPRWRELGVVLALALGAGLTVKGGIAVLGPDSMALLRNSSLLVLPFLGAYFAWKRRLPVRGVVVLVAVFALLAVVLNGFPFVPGGSTEVLAALHAPVVLWVLVGVAYVGGRWRSHDGRMDFVRFTGELVVYYALLALGGGVLTVLAGALFALVGTDLEPVLEAWIFPLCVPGALIVAAWLVEAKKDVVENIAPVLTRVFTPLTILLLVSVLPLLAGAGGLTDVDRELLILMDAILVLVLCLLLYSISARDPLAPPGLFDVLQVVLVVAAIVVDGVMLAAMLTRIAEFGVSPNKVAALGLNLVLFAHLLRAAWLGLGFVRRRVPFGAVERWQTGYLPAYGLWAAVVVVAFPLVFRFV
ncbi:permease prefix domain 1-containing protein [Isoptericola sp. NEAU-Y5]|uniref:Permease prefix domain 1-containing protein n=1 Tax=Isoptericola luteus TaxID=2879484 RepID=A0ABS7ZDH0_9MICO|nr:permease prefix domain 1-containing protein [Isoptericola sp. NEAU-Y5]MCA5893086.1 permease prefix domain 1-containing protein [Isoptericola sp. NEAU-Y5]